MPASTYNITLTGAWELLSFDADSVILGVWSGDPVQIAVRTSATPPLDGKRGLQFLKNTNATNDRDKPNFITEDGEYLFIKGKTGDEIVVAGSNIQIGTII